MRLYRIWLTQFYHPNTPVWSQRQLCPTWTAKCCTNQSLLISQKNMIYLYVYQMLYALVTKAPIGHNDFNHAMECLLFLHTVWQCIISFWTHDNDTNLTSVDGLTATSVLLQQLLQYIEIYHSLLVASILEQLLTDPTDLLQHDELSRVLCYSNLSSLEEVADYGKDIETSQCLSWW